MTLKERKQTSECECEYILLLLPPILFHSNMRMHILSPFLFLLGAESESSADGASGVLSDSSALHPDVDSGDGIAIAS